MEEKHQVAVSLDELSFEVPLDSELVAQTDCSHSQIRYEKEDTPTDQDSYNIAADLTDESLTNQNKYNILTDKTDHKSLDKLEDEDVAKDFYPIENNDGAKVIIESDIDIELVKRTDQSNASNETSFSDVINNQSDEEDFELDEQPLSFVLKKKDDDDDDDFEFEFPQHSKEPSHQKDEFEVSLTSHSNNTKTVHFSEPLNGLNDENIATNSEQHNNLDPEILTPREKTKSDLEIALDTEKKISSESKIEDYKRRFEEPIKKKKEEGQNITTDEIESKKPKIVSTEDEIERKKQHIVSTEDEIERKKPDIVSTADDWDQVQVIVPGFAAGDQSKSGAIPILESKPLATFSESWSKMASMSYDDVKGQIKTCTERKGISALTHFLFGPPKLRRDLHEERDLVFSIAATKFNNENEVHNSILQTVYRCLTGSKFDCQRFGSHWEEIGFQGQDPATDLRGSGVLSLLHILFFLQDPSTKELARDIYKLSLHPTQNFPFCVMSINITVMCLRVVREDVYNKEFNKRRDVIGTMNCLYAALFLNLYQMWKKGKTIHDSGYVLEEVTSYCHKNSKSIFKDLENYQKTKKEQSIFGDHASDNTTFFNVCKQEKCDTKITAELY